MNSAFIGDVAERGRPDPEELLRRIEAEESRARRGRLKVFLGYASRVGKSYRMLDEARRRQERGQDVVVAAMQGHAASLDLDALIRRHPSLCVVDGLAHDNPPGSRHPTRWQDVEELLV